MWLFILNSALLGVGLAMDAFSVSLANGFADTKMSRRKRLEISGVYAAFQFIMPFIGWFLVHNAANIFSGLNVLIPWIALFLLALPIAIAYCIDPDETKEELQDIIDMIRRYDIQDQMSLYQEAKWVEEVIGSCTTITQWVYANRLIFLLEEKYDKKVKRVINSNIKYRLKGISNRKLEILNEARR